MLRGRTVLASLLVLTVVALFGLQAGAYTLFTADPPESGRCTQCHDDWPGATHTFHQTFACSNCHINDDPVAPTACLNCHELVDIFDLHSPLEGPGDMNYCGYCHEGVSNETHSWGEMKALFE